MPEVLKSRIVEVPLAAVEPHPHNVRLDSSQDLASLAESIRQRGLIHPILVRPHPDPERFGQYQIVCGERRYRALRQLAQADPDQFGTVPVRVEPLDDTDTLLAVLQENALRRDFSPYERAAFYRALYEDEHFPSIRAMARKLGIGLTTLHRYLRVFDLPGRIVAQFRDGRLSLSDVEVVLDSPEALRPEVAELLSDQGLRKAEARRLAARLAQPETMDWRDRLADHFRQQAGSSVCAAGDGVELKVAAQTPDALRRQLQALLAALDAEA